MKILRHFPFYLLVLFFSGCSWFEIERPKEPDPVLPPITQEGKNTIGFTYDSGKVWVPKGGINNPSLSVSYGNYSYAEAFLYLHGNRVEKDGLFHLGIEYENIVDIGEYILTHSGDGTKIGYFRVSNGEEKEEFETDSMHIGKLIITRPDTTNTIISGTFYFDAVSKEGNVVQIRDGRFDLNYTYY